MPFLALNCVLLVHSNCNYFYSRHTEYTKPAVKRRGRLLRKQVWERKVLRCRGVRCGNGMSKWEESVPLGRTPFLENMISFCLEITSSGAFWRNVVSSYACNRKGYKTRFLSARTVGYSLTTNCVVETRYTLHRAIYKTLAGPTHRHFSRAAVNFGMSRINTRRPKSNLRRRQTVTVASLQLEHVAENTGHGLGTSFPRPK